MTRTELGTHELLRLLLREALADREIDDTDLSRIRHLGTLLGLTSKEVEAEFAAVKTMPPRTEPESPFNSLRLFAAAADLAAADGVLTAEEETCLYALKEVLKLSDDQYQETLKTLRERCCGPLENEPVDEQPELPTRINANDVIVRLFENIEKVIIGKQNVIRLVITAAMANAHVLLEDVPGTGKTMLARALAASLDCVCKRVQFTPDLLPMDVTGNMIFNPKTSQFTFKRGPVFTNILLADEINRATPRTQSSLLEVMEERQVSVDGAAYPMAQLFFVLATQNPIDQHGTYPLPEAQLDRFLFRVRMGYPEPTAEQEMLAAHVRGSPLRSLQAVVPKAEFIALQRHVQESVQVSPEVQQYILHLLAALRAHPDLVLGPSPRAAIALMRGSMALACLEGRSFVIPDDVKELALPALAHRLVLSPQALVKQVPAEEIVASALKSVRVPTGQSTKPG